MEKFYFYALHWRLSTSVVVLRHSFVHKVKLPYDGGSHLQSALVVRRANPLCVAHSAPRRSFIPTPTPFVGLSYPFILRASSRFCFRCRDRPILRRFRLSDTNVYTSVLAVHSTLFGDLHLLTVVNPLGSPVIKARKRGRTPE